MFRTILNVFVLLSLVTSPFVQFLPVDTGSTSQANDLLLSDPQALVDNNLPWNPQPLNYVRGEVIISMKEGVPFDQSAWMGGENPGTTPESLEEATDQVTPLSIRPLLKAGLSRSLGSTQGAVHPLLRTYILTFPQDVNILDLVKNYREMDEVAFAEPNYIYKIASEDSPADVDITPNDPDYSSQDHLPRINASNAWNTTTGSTTITIAILDTGVLTDHVDLTNRVVYGYDYVNDDTLPADDNGHGTEMTGIIGAETNNGIGIAGLDWNAQILVIKVADDTGAATSDQLVQGITDAVDSGADIINISLGSSSASILVQTAVDYAYDNNVTLIAAAGNNQENAPYYPASFPHVMSIAAVTTSGILADRKTALSNWDYTVDLTAPGTQIYTTILDGTYDTTPATSGTSAAAAIVSGVAGLVKAVHPTWTPDQVMGQIAGSSFDNLETGNNEDYKNMIGAGRVDAAGAVGSGAVGPISYAGFTVDDPHGDGDGQASPGDVIDLSVLLKTYDDLTTGAYATLTTSDSYFVCGTDPITYTEMTFGVITPSSPLTCTISASAPVGHAATFNYTAHGGASGNVSESFQVEIHPNPKDGWPLNIGWPTLSSPVLGDLQKDSQTEIYLPTIENKLHGWNVAGNVLPGWPKDGLGIIGDPAIADLDRDGMDEIILPGAVYEADGTPMAGWPRDIPVSGTCGFALAAPAIGDVTGDGFLDIVFGTVDQYLHVYNMNGTPVEGWPKYMGASILTSVALANLDTDAALEIIVATSPLGITLGDINIDLCGATDEGGIHVLNGNGSEMSGWPQLGYPTTSAPVLGDIDGDGNLEIVVAEMAFETNGSLVTGFTDKPLITVSDSPALADVDGNGVVDIVYAGTSIDLASLSLTSDIYAVDGTGKNLTGWPVNDLGLPVSSSPIIVDMDGDNTLDVVVTTGGSKVYAWDAGSNLLDGFPLSMGDGIDELGMTSSPAAGDVDGDGRLDLFSPAGGLLTDFFAWEMDPGSYNASKMPWPQYHHDLWNTGTYGFVTAPSPGAITINDFALATDSVNVTLTLSAPGMTYMKINNSNTGWAGVPCTPFASPFPWALTTGSGTKTVYARFYSSSTCMGATTTYQDSILLDTNIPVVAITSPTDGANLLARRSIPVYGTATDTNFYRYESSHGAGASPTTWTWMGSGYSAIPSPTQVGTLWTDHVPDGINVLRLIAEDTAANQGEGQVNINLGRIRDVAGTLTPTQVVPGEVVQFEVDVINPMASVLNLTTETTFWLHDLNPVKATLVPPFNPPGPFDSYEFPMMGVWYGQTFTAPETFFLSRVGIPITLGFGSDIQMEIRPVDGSGLPALPALATSTSSGFAVGTETELVFEDVNCWMQAGETYAVVLKPTQSLSYILSTQEDGSLPGSAYQYAVSEPVDDENWELQTYDFPLYLYRPLAYAASLVSPTALPSSGTDGLTFETAAIPPTFGPQAYVPTITYFGTEGASAEFFTFTQSDVNTVGLIGDPPTMTISDASLTEPISGTRQMVFAVNLTGTSFYDITVDYSTTNVTAESGLDYEGQSGVLTIPSGAISGKINVPIFEDDLVEGTETFLVDLTNPDHAILTDDQAVGTIYDTDVPFSVNVLDSLMIENPGTIPMPFIIYIPVTSTLPITVEYTTVDGTALAGSDYVATSGTLVFEPGDTYKTVLVYLMEDTEDEGNETFYLQLMNPINVPLGDDIGVGTIIDNDITYHIFLPLVMKN